jgi:hypothetical protein
MARRQPTTDHVEVAAVITGAIAPVYEQLAQINTRFKELNGSVSRTIERVAIVETKIERVPSDIAESAKLSSVSLKLWMLLMIAGAVGQAAITVLGQIVGKP